MYIASEAATAICVDAAGEIDNMVTCFRKNTCSANTDIAIFTVKIKMTGTIWFEQFRMVLPGFEGKVNSRRKVLFAIIFRVAKVNEKTAGVGREGVQVVDP